MCTYFGCSFFIPGIVLVGLWLAAWLLVAILALWAIIGLRVIPALLAMGLGSILLYATS